jgi:hypothetical protein
MVIYMKKLVLFLILGMLFFAGCVNSPLEEEEQPSKEELLEDMNMPPQSYDEKPIIVDDGAVTIKAEKQGMRWLFPFDVYEDEFIDVGLHTDNFIRLDKDHINILDDSEKIWIHLMIKNETGIIFDAVYSREIRNCDAMEVDILGKTYDMSALENDSSFENDDKWKIGHEYEDGCLKRIIIYLNGYFYDLDENEWAGLFRNDGTLRLSFRNLDVQPSAKLVVTPPNS